MSPLLTIEAPTDAQLLTIHAMLAERDLPRPDAVASKAEASEIIRAISHNVYDPGRYAYPFSMSDDEIPF